MKALFSLAISAVIWHAVHLDKLVSVVPGTWHAVNAVLAGVR